jgi:hypothetical protein
MELYSYCGGRVREAFCGREECRRPRGGTNPFVIVLPATCTETPDWVYGNPGIRMPGTRTPGSYSQGPALAGDLDEDRAVGRGVRDPGDCR